jgi:hypothetical protein
MFPQPVVGAWPQELINDTAGWRDMANDTECIQ